MKLEEEGTSKFLGKEIDIEIYACDETKPAAGMVLTTGDMSSGGTEKELCSPLCPG